MPLPRGAPTQYPCAFPIASIDKLPHCFVYCASHYSRAGRVVQSDTVCARIMPATSLSGTLQLPRERPTSLKSPDTLSAGPYSSAPTPSSGSVLSSSLDELLLGRAPSSTTAQTTMTRESGASLDYDARAMPRREHSPEGFEMTAALASATDSASRCTRAKRRTNISMSRPIDRTRQRTRQRTMSRKLCTSSH